MDSLATVVSITIAVAFAIIAIVRYDAFSLVVMTALAGSLAGFYWWNKPPARIFMGDSGSMFIGLLLAAGSIAKPSKSPTAIIITGPIIALALPVLDTLMVMKERFGGRATPISTRLSRLFNADRRHIHHILLVRFGSETKAIVSIWLVTLLFAIAAVMTAIDDMKTIGYSAGIVALIAMVVLRWERRRKERDHAARNAA
jgi:UDP-GlcNAc:undecaprenyl-phosphate GlcNAc-1-phosphate transferase